jgi:hypothetical protein
LPGAADGGPQRAPQPERRAPVDSEDPVLDQVERIVVAADTVGDPIEKTQVPEQAAAERLQAEAVEHERVVEVGPEGDPGGVAVDPLRRDGVKLAGERVEPRALSRVLDRPCLREDAPREVERPEPGRRRGRVENTCTGHHRAVAARIA